jgi:hypothetical protein
MPIEEREDRRPTCSADRSRATTRGYAPEAACALLDRASNCLVSYGPTQADVQLRLLLVRRTGLSAKPARLDHGHRRGHGNHRDRTRPPGAKSRNTASWLGRRHMKLWRRSALPQDARRSDHVQPYGRADLELGMRTHEADVQLRPVVQGA